MSQRLGRKQLATMKCCQTMDDEMLPTKQGWWNTADVPSKASHLCSISKLFPSFI